MTQHGSNIPAEGALAEVQRLTVERRDLDSLLRHRVQFLIDSARREGFDVGFRMGHDAAYLEWSREDDERPTPQERGGDEDLENEQDVLFT
jgi:hypothetical protein